MTIPSDKTLTVEPTDLSLPGYSSIWIRTAAGPQIGFGHLRRCMVLARSLMDCGKPLFLLDPADRWSQEQLADRGFDYFAEEPNRAWERLAEPAVIIIDTRLTNGLDSLITTARDRNIPIVNIRDLGLNALSSDIAVDGSVVPALRDVKSKSQKLLSGPDYMILDPCYRILHQKEKEIRQRIQSIYINLGGGKSHKYYSKVLEGLRLWACEAEVVGVPGFVGWGQERLAEMDWYPLSFRWEYSSTDQFLFQADLAITAGGLAAYEALCAGTPLLALSYDLLQQVTISGIETAGACINLGLGDDLNPARFAEEIAVIDAGYEDRKRLSSNGRKIVDGLGSERVSHAIHQLISEQSTAGH